jgi:hypothetical protein
MLDIDLFLKSLKASWIKRFIFQPDSKLIRIYTNMLSNYGGRLILKSNYHEQEVKDLNIKSEFLKNILCGWLSISLDKNDIPIQKQLIWNNSSIKNENKTFFIKTWFDRGIQFIEHIYDFRKRAFYSFQDIINLYEIDKADFIKYHKIVKSIPVEWKNKLKENDIIYTAPQYMLNQITEHTKACQMVYKSLILKHKPEVFKQFDKWKVTLNNQNINQRTIFSQPIKLTIDTKLRNFQYKYLMHILQKNTFLHKCNLVSTTLCDFFLYAHRNGYSRILGLSSYSKVLDGYTKLYLRQVRKVRKLGAKFCNYIFL